MACPLPVAKRVVMADEYARIIARARLQDGEKIRVPAWLQRLGDKMITGESTVTWALHLNTNLLRYARLLGVGPEHEVSKAKVRPIFYYTIRAVIEWCAVNRIQINPSSEAPDYLRRRYGA